VTDLQSQSPDQDVRAGIARGDKLRRAREGRRRLWRAAPFVAAVCLGVAGIGRWLGWSPVLALVVLGLAAAALAVAVWFAIRFRPVSDSVAARLDDDAGLSGELRSAHWFATSERRDPWTSFHLERAAERLGAIDWTRCYPAVRAPRAWAATAVIVAGVLALSARWPGRATGPLPASAASAVEAGKPVFSLTDILSPELQKQLADLLAKVESGKLSSEALKALSPELRNLLAQLAALRDPQTLKDLAPDAAKAEAANRAGQAKAMKALAERAKRAAGEQALPSDLKQALNDLADTLNDAATEQAASLEASESVASKGAEQGGAKQASASADASQASIQFSRDADASAGSGMSMLSDAGFPSGDARPGSGAGGNSGDKKGAGQMLGVEQALRRETVEADKDAAGDNVTTETRRKSEQGQAAVNFTHAASGTFDRSHAAAPPPVPEARRAQVQAYFIRKQ
jgi:hypothetical protein